MILLIGVVVGLILGLTGAGGSILAVPLLMFGMGWTLTQAAPVALIAVATAAVTGTWIAWQRSYVRYRAATVMGVLGLVVAPWGLAAAKAVPLNALTLAFAAVLSVVAVRMLRQAAQTPSETAVVRAVVAGDDQPAKGPICKLNPNSGRLIWTRPCALVMAASGAATGLLSGLFGVGGGFVIVPALRAATELSMHSAVATSLMAIALISSGTLAIAVLQGFELPLRVALPFAGGAVLGMLLGRWLAPRIAGPRLQQGFALLMLFTATGIAVHIADQTGVF